MNLKYLLFILLIGGRLNVRSQKIHEPYEFTKAIEKGTRTRIGLPGEEYWQNNSTYSIKANFNPETGIVNGSMEVTYNNLSNDTISKLVFKLMQNMYAKTGLRVNAIDTINLHDGVKISNVTINGKKTADSNIILENTKLILELTDSLMPGKSNNVSMDFTIPIPRRTQVRTGAYDSTSYFVGYWFPQLAVYDDLFGWDMGEYMGNSEAYNDFSDYKVEITVPENFMVWSTGDLQNENEIFQTGIIEKIALSRNIKDSVINIITEDDLKSNNVFKTDTELTYKFLATNVPDFAWTTSDHYLWDASMAYNPDQANVCWVQAAYAPSKEAFSLSTTMAKKSVEFFSNVFPAVKYPYSHHLSFNARIGGGMEFPMLANNGYSSDTFRIALLTAHELAHNYFPFMMGINERKYGWFDEMMTTVMHHKFVSQLENGKFKVYNNERNMKPAKEISGRSFDMPLIIETETVVKDEPWLLNGYIKSLNMLLSLETIIGEDNFTQYLKKFMLTWNGKHPTPYDFFYSINIQSGKDLNWFWNKWVFSFAYPDLGLEADKNNNVILIKNKGEQPIPFTLTLEFKNGEKEIVEYGAGVWESGTDVVNEVKKLSKVKKVKVECSFVPDIYNEDNEILF